MPRVKKEKKFEEPVIPQESKDIVTPGGDPTGQRERYHAYLKEHPEHVVVAGEHLTF